MVWHFSAIAIGLKSGDQLLFGRASAGLLVLIASLGFFITPALVGGAKAPMIEQPVILQINELRNWQLGQRARGDPPDLDHHDLPRL